MSLSHLWIDVVGIVRHSYNLERFEVRTSSRAALSQLPAAVFWLRFSECRSSLLVMPPVTLAQLPHVRLFTDAGVVSDPFAADLLHVVYA